MTDSVIGMFESNKEVQKPIKEKLPEASLKPVPMFDEQALLPESLRWWIVDEAKRSGAAIEYVAVAALVAAGNLVGPKVAVQPKNHDYQWTIYMNFWGAAIGIPSLKKSPAVKAGMRHLTTIEKIISDRYKAALKDYKDSEKVRAAKVRAATKHIEKLTTKRLEDETAVSQADMEHAEKSLQELYVPAPKCQRLTVNDATVEALGEILNLNPGVLQFRDELSGWLNGLNREDRHNDRAFFLEAFNGTGSYTYDRIGRGTIHIEHNIIGVMGGIQPDKLKPLVRAAVSGGSDNDGLIQRFQLMVYPDKPDGEDEDRAPHGPSMECACEVYDRLFGLPYRGTPLQFDEQAFPVFTVWRRALLKRIGTNHMHPVMEGHLAKYEKLCAGLAGLFALIEQREAIAAQDTERAIKWCSLLEKHAERIYGMADTADMDAARLLLSRRKILGDAFKVHHVRDRKWAGMSSTKEVKDAIEVLLEYGQIEQFNQNGTWYKWVE